MKQTSIVSVIWFLKFLIYLFLVDKLQRLAFIKVKKQKQNITQNSW